MKTLDIKDYLVNNPNATLQEYQDYLDQSKSTEFNEAYSLYTEIKNYFDSFGNNTIELKNVGYAPGEDSVFFLAKDVTVTFIDDNDYQYPKLNIKDCIYIDHPYDSDERISIRVGTFWSEAEFLKDIFSKRDDIIKAHNDTLLYRNLWDVLEESNERICELLKI